MVRLPFIYAVFLAFMFTRQINVFKLLCYLLIMFSSSQNKRLVKKRCSAIAKRPRCRMR